MNPALPPAPAARPALSAPAAGRIARIAAASPAFRAMFGELGKSRAPLYAALLILPYAGVLVGLDVAAHYGALTDAPLPVQFNLASDNGFGEWLEYSLTASIGTMLLLLCIESFDWAYLVNGLLFGWLTLDNSLQIHESSGRALEPLFAHSGLPLQGHDIGEATGFLAVGCIWLTGLALSLRKARWRPTVYALMLAACVVGAAFFGVLVDMAVVWGPHSPARLEIETFIEDGGEFAMIIVSFLLTVAIYDTERRRGAAA